MTYNWRRLKSSLQLVYNQISQLSSNTEKESQAAIIQQPQEREEQFQYVKYNLMITLQNATVLKRFIFGHIVD